MDEKVLEPVVRSFYKKAMEDDSSFSIPFQRVDLDHHVEKQVDFLCNVMNGEKERYKGGEEKLYRMHKFFAESFMTGENGRKWLRLMKDSIDENPGSEVLLGVVEAEMDRYGHQFGFSRL